MRFLHIIVVCLTKWVLSVTAQNTYTAAVLEHAPTQEDTPMDTILTNLNEYRRYTQTAKAKEADIIVFPEYGLTGLIDNIEDYAINLESMSASDKKIMEEIKNIAYEHNIYLVINFIESVQDGGGNIDYYNTDIVYDRRGNVVTKYRKINLFNEPKLIAGNETVKFTTDFDVTFGILTCWDINVHTPAKTILEDGVTDIVLLSAWTSSMPFYTSLSVQHGYAQANGINLLAANYDDPRKSHGGSGIYLADGRIAEAYIAGDHSSKLIVQKVKKISSRPSNACVKFKVFSAPGGLIPQPNITTYITRKDFSHSDYSFKKLDLSKSETSETVCDDDFCCTFNISIGQANTNEMYQMMVYNGGATLDGDSGHLYICTLLACKSSDSSSCGERINGTTRFNQITIEGDFPYDNTTFYQPLTLTYDLVPVTETSFCGSSGNGTTFDARLVTSGSQDKLLVFGIYGKSSDATVNVATTFLTFLAVSVLKLIL